MYFVFKFYGSANSALARKDFQRTGKPISWGTILVKSILFALVIGVLMECLSGCSSDTQGSGGTGGNNAATGALGAPGTGPEMTIPAPIPTYQPQMNYAPVESAATDGVQG